MGDTEKLYDEQIAPKLQELAKLCDSNGLPFLAAVWYDGVRSDACGLTQVHPPGCKANPGWTLMRQCWDARGNIDALCIGLARRVKPENDGSIVLRMLRKGGE